MISSWLLIAAAHTSDQQAADKRAWSLLPARASVLQAHSLHAADVGQPHLRTYICPLKRVGGKRACTLVAGLKKTERDMIKIYEACPESKDTSRVGR
jgi:hypothetical protein